MQRKTALYEQHLAAGARMVDFAGWQMPLHYGSQIEEHHQVRGAKGMFDVSHMAVVDLAGDRVRDYLGCLLANDVVRLAQSGRALYSCMLNERGGVIDDLIVYYQDPRHFRMVVNAATRDKDSAWLQDHALDYGVEVAPRADLAMLAVQGPEARDAVHAVLEPALSEAVQALPRFGAAWRDEWFVGRTGYTGEDGYEVMVPNVVAPDLWQRLMGQGVKPVGLAARDTLRLEAGMNLYGSDMDEATTPLESNLAWTVSWEPAERQFIGRGALEIQKSAGVARRLVGLVLEGRGVLRDHQTVYCAAGDGEVTSGSFSPTLGKAIAFARVPAGTQGEVGVEVRGRRLPARVVKPPFVRNGEPCV
jgi:aminomethyltransferase